jgi:hypothetical protein
VWAYFVDFRARTEPWAATTTEGREVARLGRDGPVYSLERDFNHVSAGWVRFLARDARTGPLAYPGRDLPFLQSDEEVPQPDPRRALPLPSEADTMTLQLYTPTQRAYIGYLRSLYPGGRVETTGDELRIAFRVAPGTAGRRHGVRVLRDGRVIATMPTFGTLPPGTRVPAVLVWRAGIRVARTGIHRFALTAPAGATLEIDGRTIAETTARRTAEGAVALPAGVHLVAINAPVSSRDDVVDLRWSKRLGSATQQAALHAFRRSQTSPAMTEPRGLTVEVVAAGAPPPGIPRVQRWLDSGVAADFGTIGDRLPLRGTMTWRGNLVVDRAGIYRMAFPSDGRVRVALAGRPIQLDRARTDGIALGRGAHPIRITLPLGEPRPSYIRWSWIPPRGSSGRSGGWSVVPPTVLRPYEPVRLVSGAPQS